MKPIHTKSDLRSFTQGNNFDSNSEKIGASDESVALDKVNFRHDEFDQDSVTRIGGELLVYPAINNACFLSAPYAALSSTYICIGTANYFLEDDRLDHVIEFWASNIAGNNAFIRIDGIVVAMSPNFPLTYNHHLQLDLNLSCVGGEIFITDYNVPPMIFNLKDLMVNGGFTFDNVHTCTQKYFSGFNIDEYTIDLGGNTNHPIFIQTILSAPAGAEPIGSGGNDVGLYDYQIRYATTDGDKTGWSKATPQIALTASYRNASTQYPYTKTYGAAPGTKSDLGIHIRFRVDNANNYDFLEIKRTRYTVGAAPGTPGIEKLLDYRLQLNQDDFYIKDIWDIGATELALDEQTADNNLSSLKRAKGIRYYNMRLNFINIEFQSRDIPLTFSERSGKKMFPVIQKMTTPTRQDGHKNPFNFAYFRSLLRGEKYGFALVGRDGNNQISFAIPIGQNSGLTENYSDYQMPNRRDVASADTQNFSNGTVKAATTDGIVGITSPVLQTHEVFDTVDSVQKLDESPKNVLSSFTLGGVRTPLNIPYLPLNPTSQNDNNVTGHAFRINNSVGVNGSVGSPSLLAYAPKAFGLNYYAQGMALVGVTTIPSHIKSLSIVRTKPAKRIVAQGLGYYSLSNPAAGVNLKSRTGFVFYSPDFESGISNFQDILDDIASGGTRYKVQLVSPLGFFSEVYSAYRDGSLTTLAHNGLDMINYVRILRENGDINAGETVPPPFSPVGVGYSPNTGDGFGYVGYGKWRSHSFPGAPFNNGNNGNTIFAIASIAPLSAGVSVRTSLFTISLAGSPVYSLANPTTPPQSQAFTDPSTQDWHEPMYIMNIIDTLADIPSSNIQNYLETESYQKVEARIGISTGANSQSYLTVDERPDDFSLTTGGANKLIFTKLAGITKAWYNVDTLSGPSLLGVVNSINNGTFVVLFNGTPFTVGGIYRTTTIPLTDTYNETRIVFDIAFNPNPGFYPNSLFIPDAGSDILVRYNTDDPLKAFGGDTTIHEAVFSPFDLNYGADGSSAINFELAIPFPYNAFNMNAEYLYPDDVQSGDPNLELHAGGLVRLNEFIAPGQEVHAKIRQIMAMFTCESRINLPYSFEVQGTAVESKFFPATHYVMRPFKWNTALSPQNQLAGFYPQYSVDYPGEENLWLHGGFRMFAQFNIDYSAQDETHTAVSKPRVGFTEVTHFCTGGIFSLQRPPNVINAPGLRTFPATNFYVIDDDTGDAKLLWDDMTEAKGSNLYAFTENGAYLIITNKTLLSTLTGDQLAAIGASGGNSYFGGYIPISKSIGMNDEFWRTAAEGYNVIQGDLSHRRMAALFFSNKTSQYRFSEGTLFDIARGGKYHSKVFPEYLSFVASGYESLLSSVYDVLHDEYWMCADRPDSSNLHHDTVVYAEKKSHSEGEYDYLFDKFTSFKGITYGMRDAQTYLLNQYGQGINGAPVVSILTGVSAKELPESKEFARVRISSNEKPMNIRFYNSKADYLADTNYSEINTLAVPLALKNYGAYEGFIPRKVTGARLRNQGREVIFKITQTGNTKFIIVDVEVGYSLLK